MNTENYIPEKGLNDIKLPSINSVLNNLRYLLGALAMSISILYLITLTKQDTANRELISVVLLIFLSGWVLAFTSHKRIFQPYRELREVKMPLINILAHVTLTVLWFFGLLMGLTILVYYSYKIIYNI